MVQSRWSILKRTELRGPGLLLLTFVAPIASEIRPHDSGRANLSSSISQLSITAALVLQCFPKIDPGLRIGEIELDPDAIERLLGHGIAGHKERELLMPLAGP